MQHNQWIVSLSGYFGRQAPADDAGFLTYASSLRQPHIYNWLKDKQAVGDTNIFKIPKIHRKYYESLSGLPDRLVILGDAVCVHNPIFAQGITLTTLGVAELSKHVAQWIKKKPDNFRGFSIAFQKKLSRHLRQSWHLTNVINLSYPQAKGNRPPLMPAIVWCFRCVLAACSEKRSVHKTFLRIFHHYAGYEAMLNPSFFIPIILYMFGTIFKSLPGIIKHKVKTL